MTAEPYLSNACAHPVCRLTGPDLSRGSVPEVRVVSEVFVFLLQRSQLLAGMGEADEELLDRALVLVRLFRKAGLYLSLEKI